MNATFIETWWAVQKTTKGVILMQKQRKRHVPGKSGELQQTNLSFEYQE